MKNENNIILLVGLLILSSCSIFKSKYVDVQYEDGKCWTEHYARISPNELLQENISNEKPRLTIKLEGENDKYLYQNLSPEQFTIELKNNKVSYEKKYGIDNIIYFDIPFQKENMN